MLGWVGLGLDGIGPGWLWAGLSLEWVGIRPVWHWAGFGLGCMALDRFDTYCDGLGSGLGWHWAGLVLGWFGAGLALGQFGTGPGCLWS